MALGSVALWIGNPIFWFWVTASLQGTQATMGPYLLLIVGILVTAVVCAKLLAMLNRRYAAVMGDNTVTVHLPWARGLGGEHEKQLRKVTVLDVVMVLSVLVAGIALFAWFVIVNPSPPSVEPGGFKH